MKKNKILFVLFSVITIVLLCVMCSVVSYSYCNLVCAMKHMGGSAPPSVALLLIIPFMLGVALSSLLSFYFYKKMNKLKIKND